MKQPGFTLIEILVVLAVISIIAAIIAPVIAKARLRANTSTCVSNLRQIGLAISAYSADYDDRIPYAIDPVDKTAIASGLSVYGAKIDPIVVALPDIQTLIRPYGATLPIFRCPSDRFLPEDPQPHTKPTWFEQYGSSYRYPTLDAFTGLTMNLHGVSSADILMSDYAPYHGGNDEAGIGNALANALYADCHVKTITWIVRSGEIDSPPQ